MMRVVTARSTRRRRASLVPMLPARSVIVARSRYTPGSNSRFRNRRFQSVAPLVPSAPTATSALPIGTSVWLATSTRMLAAPLRSSVAARSATGPRLVSAGRSAPSDTPGAVVSMVTGTTVSLTTPCASVSVVWMPYTPSATPVPAQVYSMGVAATTGTAVPNVSTIAPV